MRIYGTNQDRSFYFTISMMNGLAKAGVALNRKVLADLAVRDKDVFAKVAAAAKAQVA